MTAPLLLAIVALAGTIGVEAPPAARWSPDGSWLAYAAEVRPLPEPTEPPWSLRPPGPRRRGVPEPTIPPTLVRLYATRADGSSTSLLDEVAGGISGPYWSADGRSLFYVRWAGLGPGRSRVEVVALEGSRGRRVVWSSELEVPAAVGVLDDPPDGSADARRLAVPQPAGGGLKVIDLADGHPIVEFPGSARPSWAPDGQRLAFARSGKPVDEVMLYDLRTGQVRALIDAPGATTLPRPQWVEGGRALFIARAIGGPEGLSETELVRVRASDGLAENVRPALSADAQPFGRDPALWGPSYAVEGDDLYTAVPVRGKPSQLVRVQLSSGGIAWKYPAMDVAFPIRVLASYAGAESPRLALAFEAPRGRSLIATCEASPTRGPIKLRPMTPEADARDAWIDALAGQAAIILRADLPAATIAGKVVDRPSALPLPGEFPADHPVIDRLRKLARWGRPLCDPPAAGRRVLEARFFFDALLGEQAAALDDLNAVEPWADNPGARSTWLALRAQAEIGVGDLPRARATIAYLKQAGPPRPSRDELRESPTGTSLTAVPRRDEFWVDLLERAVEAASKVKPEPGVGSKGRSRASTATEPREDRQGGDAFPRPFAHIEPR